MLETALNQVTLLVPLITAFSHWQLLSQAAIFKLFHLLELDKALKLSWHIISF